MFCSLAALTELLDCLFQCFPMFTTFKLLSDQRTARCNCNIDYQTRSFCETAQLLPLSQWESTHSWSAEQSHNNEAVCDPMFDLMHLFSVVVQCDRHTSLTLNIFSRSVCMANSLCALLLNHHKHVFSIYLPQCVFSY